MKELFDKISRRTSKMVTKKYSTSFSLGIMLLDKPLRPHIYAIYGFVRFADEIVDSFHGHDKAQLLQEFKEEAYKSIDRKIGLNPILNAFQETVHEFQINLELVETFLKSMEMDLSPPQNFSQSSYEEYILGSAEVVGLMCLKVFCYGDDAQYEELKPEAMKLGSAFQKINFLRDLHSDYNDLGRVYFPGIDIQDFNRETKLEIEADIEVDFKKGYEGILKLPKKARFGVYIAYVYYYALFQKIKTMKPETILSRRVRIPNRSKYRLLVSSYFRHSFNWL